MSKESIPVIEALKKINKYFPFEEKILISNDYNIGHQLLRTLTKEGINWINFRPETINSLVLDLLEEDLIGKNISLLSFSSMQIMVDDIFTRLANANKLKYFQKHAVNKGIVQVLTQSIKELRELGFSSKNIPENAFVRKQKAEDIKIIMREVEKHFESADLIDNAGLLLRAREKASKRNKTTDPKYIVLSRDYRLGIERELIKTIAGDNLIIVEESIVEGLEKPQGYWTPNIPLEHDEISSDADRLRWLFKGAQFPEKFDDGTIEIFGACGARNEIREVFRRVLSKGISFDEVEVVCTSSPEYIPLIYSLCEKLGIPANFSEGVPGYFTSSGRALTGYLLWMKNDFEDIYLRALLSSGDIRVKNCSYLSRLLRESGIGWGRKRYISVLKQKIKESEEKIAGLEEERDYLSKHKEGLEHLEKFCQKILEKVPVPDDDGTVDIIELCESCETFLSKYAKSVTVRDQIHINTARDRLSLIKEVARTRISLEEALDRILKVVSSIRVDSVSARPGHLFVSSVKNGGKSARSNTFLVGLDERSFPGHEMQNPVLLDEERQKISRDLVLSDEQISKNLYDMAGLLSGVKGNVTASYSSYSVAEERKVFPSSMLLQIYRIASGTPEADYEALFEHLGEPFASVPLKGAEIDDSEWWLARLAENGKMREAIRSVVCLYPGIKDGSKAEIDRNSPRITEYCGKITPQESLDPSESGEIVSSSRLETAAKCPFKYFMQYLLDIRKPEGTEKELGSWLDALHRGSFLHEVFQRFSDTIMDETLPKNRPKKKILMRVFDDVIKKYKKIIPAPAEWVFKNEYVQLKRDLDFFLDLNGRLGTKTVMAEKRFGFDGKDPKYINLSGGRQLRIKGTIDRIDHAGDSKYHVWDYKTGSSYAYSSREFIAGGTQIQHVIYSVVAELILRANGKKDAKVVCSGYLFPTGKGAKRGEGVVYRRDPRKTDRWERAMELILDLISEACFFMADPKKTPCNFCDYAEVCGDEPKNFGLKDEEQNEALKIWKKLKEYE